MADSVVRCAHRSAARAAGHLGAVPDALESPVSPSPAHSPRRARRGVIAASIAVSLALPLALSGCGLGGGDSADAGPPPAPLPAQLVDAPAQPVALGDVVAPGADTPAKVAAALTKTDEVVVIGFVLSGVADDERVAAAIRQARKSGAGARGVRYFTFRIGEKDASFGDLPDMLQIEGTPSVAVIGRDRKLSNLFEGLIDADILRQGIQTAKETQPALVDPTSPEPTAKAKAKAKGDAKG